MRAGRVSDRVSDRVAGRDHVGLAAPDACRRRASSSFGAGGALIGALILAACAGGEEPGHAPLPALDIDRARIPVSGLSAGGDQ